MASIDKSPPRMPGINGRRGVFQLLFAVVYLVIGASFLLIPTTPSRAEALRWLIELMPLWPFACLWLAAGLTGAVSAFYCRPRDWVGFFALTLVPAIWGFLFLIGVFFGAPPLGIVSTAIYWLLAAAMMVVAGMQGPHDRDTRDVAL
jgi:hypothetical protein